MTMTDDIEKVKIMWVDHENESADSQGYTTFRGRIFRIFYTENNKLLSIYPCDQDGAPVSLYLSGSKVGDMDVVLGRLVDDIGDQNMEEFLHWSFRVFADMGVLPIKMGDLVNILYSQLSTITDEDHAAVMTSMIVNDFAKNDMAEG